MSIATTNPMISQPVRTGPKFFGLYTAVVFGANDPSGQGRLQVSIPSIGVGPSWARACIACAGRSVGTAVVGFEAGDAASPIVLGFLS